MTKKKKRNFSWAQRSLGTASVQLSDISIETKSALSEVF